MSFDLSSLDRLENAWRNPVPDWAPKTSIHQSPHELIAVTKPRYFPREPMSDRAKNDYVWPIGPKQPTINPEIEARQKAWAEVKRRHPFLGSLLTK